MKSMKTYLIVWLGGLVAGFILLDRWQRASGSLPPATDDGGQGVETDTARTAMEVSADRPGVRAVVVAGAKADAERARRLLERVKPWGSASAPSLAQLRRSGHAATPADTPDPA